MKSIIKTKALLLDIGGVMLTKGWGKDSRKASAERFGYDYKDAEARHQTIFHTYEEGNVSLDEYLHHTIFYEPRSFSYDELKAFMYAQSQPYPEMLNLFRLIKDQYRLKVIAVSNEGRELAVYRTQHFDLTSLIDFFVYSSFVHLRKPDLRMYQLALDQGFVSADEVIYVDDSEILIEVAQELNIPSIHQTGYAATIQAFEEMGLPVEGVLQTV